MTTESRNSSSNRSRKNSVSTIGAIVGSGGMALDNGSNSLTPNKKLGSNNTPNITESSVGESIQSRTSRLSRQRELGPPDEVHISLPMKGHKEMGQYHYLTGLDVSSTAAPYMYLRTLQLETSNTSSISKATEMRPTVGTYCSYNCFSRGDLRIRCTFPGPPPRVQFIPSDEKKGIMNVTEKSNLWVETHVSGLVRALLFCDDIARQLPGMCKLNPLTSTQSAKTAVILMCRMLPRGPATGCSDLVNVPSLNQNYLVDALLKLLKITKLHKLALEKIDEFHPELDFTLLKVQIYLLSDQQIKAVKLMYEALMENPRDGLILNQQAKYLISKNRADLALTSALRAIECLPAEFDCWSTLVEVHILNKDYASALLALNSCPMYSTKSKDIYKALMPQDFSFPFPNEGKIEKVWDDAESFGAVSGLGGIAEFSNPSNVNEVNPMYYNVYQTTRFQSTFAKAYDHLAVLSRKLGWAELLKLRSKVFVMEDEYATTVDNDLKKSREEIAAARSRSASNANTLQVNSNSSSNSNGNSASTSRSVSPMRLRSGSIQMQKFKSKRLSERWLDTLFSIFYEELRSVLMWESENEDIGGENEHIALEWELIGSSCFRIHHFNTIPLKTALQGRYSIFAAKTLLEYYIYYNENPVEFKLLNPKLNHDSLLSFEYILDLVVKTISYNYRWYGEFSVLCLQVLSMLIEQEGAAMISANVGVNYEGQGIETVVERMLNWIDQFNDN